MNARDAWMRGVRDAQRGRPPIFREAGGVIRAEIDDDMAEEWDDEARSAYLSGYAEAE